jgi:hypothetical protein
MPGTDPARGQPVLRGFSTRVRAVLAARCKKEEVFMRALRAMLWTIVVTFLATGMVAAQRGPMLGPMGANVTGAVFRGVFNPTVGSGAAYDMVGQDGKKDQVDVAVVGKEAVSGKQGYWVEVSFTNAQTNGPVYMKTLMVIDGNNASITRTIVQPPGMGPMELPAGMMQGMPQSTPTDVRDSAEKVGTESVTTPAGTFDCDHYRGKDGTWDAWISTQVMPWGIVKSTGKDMSMTLTKVISNATDHITGTPQTMDQMMRGMGRGR